jgi:hypothetical protein
VSGFGVQIFKSDGSLFFDTSVAIGGVFLGTRSYAPTDTATETFPAFAGATPLVTPLVAEGTVGVAVDTSLGYPRVTVSSGGVGRRFAVMVI